MNRCGCPFRGGRARSTAALTNQLEIRPPLVRTFFRFFLRGSCGVHAVKPNSGSARPVRHDFRSRGDRRRAIPGEPRRPPEGSDHPTTDLRSVCRVTSSSPPKGSDRALVDRRSCPEKSPTMPLACLDVSGGSRRSSDRVALGVASAALFERPSIAWCSTRPLVFGQVLGPGHRGACRRSLRHGMPCAATYVVEQRIRDRRFVAPPLPMAPWRSTERRGGPSFTFDHMTTMGSRSDVDHRGPGR